MNLKISTHCGYIHLRKTKLLLSSWKRRFYTLEGSTFSIFRAEKEASKKVMDSMIIVEANRLPGLNHGLVLNGIDGRVWKMYVENDSHQLFMHVLGLVTVLKNNICTTIWSGDVLISASRGWLYVRSSGQNDWKHRYVEMHGKHIAFYDMNLEGQGAKREGVIMELQTKTGREFGMDFKLQNGKFIRTFGKSEQDVAYWETAVQRNSFFLAEEGCVLKSV